MSWLDEAIATARRRVERASRASTSADAFGDVQAERLAQITRDFPWMPTITKIALAASGADDAKVQQVAQTVVRRKMFSGSGQWASPGEVVRWVGRDTANVIDRITPEPVERFVGRAKDVTVDQIAESPINKGLARGVTAAFQSAQEDIDATTRQIAKDIREKGVAGGLAEVAGSMFGTSNPDIDWRDYTAGQMLHGKDSGEGFFPGGEAREAQVAKARSYGTIGGNAITLGRLTASTVFQPGSRPYNVASGLIDLVPEVADPTAYVLKTGTRAVRQARNLTAPVTEAAVARAAANAPDAWRAEVEAVAGVVSAGSRRTVIPAAVDKWLFEDTGRKVVESLAADSSPASIWRRTRGKIPADIAAQLADAPDSRRVLEILRPALGLGVDPTDFHRVNVIPSMQRHVRAFNLMPETFLPIDDPDALIRNLDTSLANANVMGAERDAILDLAFREVVAAPTADRLHNLANVAAKAVEQSLIKHGADPDLARAMTSWKSRWVAQSRFLSDNTGAPVNLPFLVDDAGDPIMGWKPSALYQLINRGVVLYDPADVRKIRGLSSALTRVGMRSKAVQYPLSAVDFAQNGVWKLSVMLRPAYNFRVNGEEIIRSNASAIFDDPGDWFAFAFGGRGRGGVTGDPFDIVKEADDLVERLPSLTGPDLAAAQARLDDIAEELHVGMTRFQAAMARGGDKQADRLADFRRTGVRQPVDRRVDPAGWQRGAAELLVAQSTDPILKRVANGGLLDGDLAANPLPGLAGVREWLINGTGVKFRRRLEAAFPDVDWTDPRIVDQYLNVQVQHVLKSTGDNPDLRQAIITGRVNGKPLAGKPSHGRRDPSDALRERMGAYVNDPNAPDVLDVEALERVTTEGFGEFMEARREVGRVFFGTIYGAASDKLARSPVFRRAYWRWMEEHFAWLSPDARAEAIENAGKWGLGSGQVRRLEQRAALPAGDLDLADADAFAKGVALDEANDLLFDASQRSQFFDIARVIFPFGEAWKEVATRWAKLFATQPKNLRRAQQIVTGLRGSDVDGDGVGVFHRDPVTGQEMFSFPLSGALMDMLGVPGVTFEGSVAGLSLGTQVMPGLGPVGQFTAAAILPDVPDTDFVAQLLFPFGEPETDGAGLTSQLIPPWLRKEFEAFNANERKDVMYANALAEMVRVLASSGDYGNTEDELSRLMSDARDRARVVTAMRGLVGAFAPSAPQPRFFASTTQGDVVSGLLFKEYAALQEKENDGEIDSAIEAFLDEFGDNAFVYLVGKTKSTVGGQGASSEYGDWERDHNEFVNKYPEIAGYFGPSVEGYNSTVYNRQLRTGRRERGGVRESLRAAQQVVGGWMWRQAKEQAGENPGPARREWLRTVREQIRSEYPAWNSDQFSAGVVSARVRSLARAAEDSSVADTPLAGAIRTYMDARDQARQAAIDRGYGESDSAFATANRAAPLRQWLRQIAASIAEDTPEFERVYTDVLDSELKDDTDGD